MNSNEYLDVIVFNIRLKVIGDRFGEKVIGGWVVYDLYNLNTCSLNLLVLSECVA